MKVEICNDGKCGGCPQCLLEQARYYLDSEVNKNELLKDELTALQKQSKEREEELVAKCIQKNSEYQVLLRMSQTYKEAAELKNSLNQNQSRALYWMNQAINLGEQLIRAESSERGIRNEAQGYRDDHLKLVDWLCDNGFGDSCGNPADDVLDLATLYLAKIKILTQFNDSMAAELADICKVAGNVLFYRGWKSKQYEKGLELRTNLITIDNQISQKKKLLPHGV